MSAARIESRLCCTHGKTASSQPDCHSMNEAIESHRNLFPVVTTILLLFQSAENIHHDGSVRYMQCTDVC